MGCDDSFTFETNFNYFMKIRWVFFVSFCFLTLALSSQNEIDSVEKKLNDSLSQEKKIEAFNKLSDLYSEQGQLETGLEYARKAYNLANKLNEQKGMNEALSNFFRNYMGQNQYDSAFSVVQKLLKIYLAADNKYQMAIQYSRLGAIYSNWGFVEKAMDYYLTAMKLSKNSKDNEFKGYLFNNIAMSYMNLSQLESAKVFFEKAENIAELIPQNLSLRTYTYDNIGSYYEISGDIEKALEYYKKSLLLKRQIGNVADIVLSFNNLASAYIKKKDYETAQSYLSKVTSFRPDTFNSPLLNIQIDREFGKLYYQMGDYNQSVLYYKKAIQNYKEINSVQLLDVIYHELANVYDAMGRFKLSNAYLQKTIELRDSIFTAKTQQIITEVRTIYNFDRNLKDVSIMKKDDEISSLQSKFNNNLILLLSSLSVVLIFFLTIVFLMFRKNKKLVISLEEKNDEVSKINKELIDNTNQLELLVNKKTHHLEEEIKQKDQLAKNLEETLKKVNAAHQAKDIFIENLQYEIRTPLNSILGLVQVFKTSKKLKTKDSQIIIDGIEQSSERLLSIFYNVLDSVDVQTESIRMHSHSEDLNYAVQLIYQINQFKANQKQLNFEFTQTEIEEVFIDKKYFSKVLYNIVDNAIKYTEKGFVKIETKPYDEQYAVIQVIDSGKGIPALKLKQLFEKKLIKENKNILGTGFALSVRLMELMDGKLEVSSKDASGTKVSIFVPYFSEEKVEDETRAIYNCEIDKGENQVLIVEDDEFNNVLLTNIVREVAIPTSVYSGKEASAIIEEKLKKDQKFDLVLLDINLPDGFSGVDLLQEIHNTFPEYQNIPFIAITAYADEQDKISFLKKGFSDYYIKPFDNRELIDKIKFKLIF